MLPTPSPYLSARQGPGLPVGARVEAAAWAGCGGVGAAVVLGVGEGVQAARPSMDGGVAAVVLLSRFL